MLQPLKTQQTHLHWKSRGEELWSFLHYYTKRAFLGIKYISNVSTCFYNHDITKIDLKCTVHVYAMEFVGALQTQFGNKNCLLTRVLERTFKIEVPTSN